MGRHRGSRCRRSCSGKVGANFSAIKGIGSVIQPDAAQAGEASGGGAWWGRGWGVGTGLTPAHMVLNWRAIRAPSASEGTTTMAPFNSAVH